MKVLSFGEILWDVFAEDKKIGGAPFNFAAHLVKNGVDAAIYSAVGKDALGEEALSHVRALGVDTACIARVEQETGVCLVTLQNGTPDYNIKAGTAMDAIPVMTLSEPYDGLYYGTLAQRDPRSAATLQQLLQAQHFEHVFCDINIRQHYYSKEILERSIGGCTVLKLSREEIGVLAETGISAAQGNEAIARDLHRRYPNLRLVIITLDADGAYVYDCIQDQDHYAPKPNCTVVSTVGAGDSFSATFFAAILQGEGVETALKKASKVSAFVVSCLGAVPDYPDGFLESL